MVLTLEKAEKMMELSDGSLDLSGTPITSLPDNLTVGGSLDLNGTRIDKSKIKKVKKLKQGDYIENRYLYADGILTHVKKEKKAEQYTLYVGKIPGKNVVFDGTNYAHCGNFREGISDLIFKSAKNRGADQYKSMSLDSRIKREEAITMYRIITGACKQGTEHFVNSLKELKEEYTVNEIIDLTKINTAQSNSESFFLNKKEEGT